MSDGRSFTNYLSSGIYNTYLEQKFGVPSDTSFREFLQTRGDQVMKTTNQLMAVDIRPEMAFPRTKPSTAVGAGDIKDAFAPAYAPSQTMTPF